jgi:PhzF family phenazine biosynthesis protein
MTPEDCCPAETTADPSTESAGPVRCAPIHQVDAFTVPGRAFSGNPAAVVPLEAWPSDRLMQAVAAENNLSETAFLVRDGGEEGDWGLRWFTPTTEVALCGHATLAAGYVVTTRLEPGRRAVRFRTASGTLTVTRHGAGDPADEVEMFDIDLPAQPPGPALDAEGRAAIAAAIGAPVEAAFDGVKWLAVVADEATVRDLAPAMDAVAALPSDGVIVTARGTSADIVSRYFCPGAGIPEDPVTGSAHTIAVPYWADRLGRPQLVARQLSPRGGWLGTAIDNGRVHLTGRVAPYLEGTIRLPADF